MDDLWPDLEPVQAANSLHQTLYFLRQYIALDALVAKSSVEYVPVESEIVYLDPELVHVESAAFMRQASDVIARGSLGPDAVRLVHSYAGRFAPEFEYEEWSIPWREQLHSLYLQLAETTARDRDSAGFPADAAAVLRRALEVDSEAIDLMPSLVRALHALGSEAAARDTYLTYSARFRKEYEADALPYSDILDST
jgi:two-component SAPR family response regulator